MRFGRTLKKSIYEPWREHYIDYKALKKLLRESDVSDHESPSRRVDEGRKWTEEDEGVFVEELINVQLEKVNAFEVDTYKQLRDRVSRCESRLEGLVSEAKGESINGEQEWGANHDGQGEEKKAILKEVLEELDNITKETNELEKYSRINFTGFLKAAKKQRGTSYRVRPLLQVRLAALPFNSEDYSPLLYQLSAMYSFIRQNIDGASRDRSKSFSEPQPSKKYKSHKCAYGTIY
jgi:SPX domain protein involved in polyphosphate accumulation